MKRRYLQAIACLGICVSPVFGCSSFEARSFWAFDLGAPTATAAPLTEIRDRGYLIVAVKDNLRPLGFRDESGELRGFEIDIARRLAAELLGNPEAILVVPVANADRLDWVMADEVDLAIAHLTQTPSRARVVSFSRPYYFDGTALITRNPDLRALSDVGNQAIAVLSGSSAIAQLRYRLPNATLLAADSYRDALAQLEGGEAAAFAGDRSVLAGWVQEYPQYRLLPEILSVAPLAIAMPKGLQYGTLRQEVDAAIVRWRSEGWLAERAAYWGLGEPAIEAGDRSDAEQISVGVR